ncbi:hypothetical protein GCM10012289_75770 [Nonomuraea cavernae]|uniref:Uncharacterized protein n=1 Tax=Nonomuraea cavernae TaxID=2045107 RepID=A0A917ZI40_9ACTN|nr:hypothetical protein GCM10012289_75770 [Nonomuraea cavernae]
MAGRDHETRPEPLRTPAPLFFNGTRGRTIIPISLVRRNVTVAFSVSPYAGNSRTKDPAYRWLKARVPNRRD